MSGNFGKLPREIRDKVYSQLLVSSHTFNVDAAYRPCYDMQPAILHVNKQISAEATRALYKDNRFIVLNLRGKAERSFAWFSRIPEEYTLPLFNVEDAALTITISCIDADRDDLAINRVFMLFPESLDAVLESLWDFIIGAFEVDYVEPILLLKISLVLHPILLSRRDAMQKDLLKPFERLVGFGEVEIHGCADEEFKSTMLDRMRQFPTPEYFHDSLQHYLGMGQKAYQLKRYNEAIHYWRLAGKYHASIATIARTWISADGDDSVELLLAAVTDSGPILHIAKLGILKAGLRLRAYFFVLREFFTWESENEELSPLLRAQVQIVASMAFHGSSLFDQGKKAFIQAQNIISLEAIPHMDHLLAIMKDISWVRQWHCNRQGHSFFSAWRSFWDLVEIDEKAKTEAGASSERSISEVDSDEEGDRETTDDESLRMRNAHRRRKTTSGKVMRWLM
ncbi:hypothetical protein MMC27_002670 [Xylographa pallens]|nr:hypothetical protein [Xylographa pallens]